MSNDYMYKLNHYLKSYFDNKSRSVQVMFSLYTNITVCLRIKYQNMIVKQLRILKKCFKLYNFTSKYCIIVIWRYYFHWTKTKLYLLFIEPNYLQFFPTHTKFFKDACCFYQLFIIVFDQLLPKIHSYCFRFSTTSTFKLKSYTKEMKVWIEEALRSSGPVNWFIDCYNNC